MELAWIIVTIYSDQFYTLLFLAEFGSRLVLDSTKYAEACYVYYGISSSFLDQQIQYQLNFSQGNLRPLDVGRELRRQQIRHTSNWQYYLEDLLLSMPSLKDSL